MLQPAFFQLDSWCWKPVCEGNACIQCGVKLAWVFTKHVLFSLTQELVCNLTLTPVCRHTAFGHQDLKSIRTPRSCSNSKEGVALIVSFGWENCIWPSSLNALSQSCMKVAGRKHSTCCTQFTCICLNDGLMCQTLGEVINKNKAKVVKVKWIAGASFLLDGVCQYRKQDYWTALYGSMWDQKPSCFWAKGNSPTCSLPLCPLSLGSHSHEKGWHKQQKLCGERWCESILTLPMQLLCRFCALAKRRVEGIPGRKAVMVPPSEEYSTPLHRKVPEDTDPELVFLCRHVYDFRHGRILKNPQ